MKYQIYLGRFSPIHHGHIGIINTMVSNFGYDNCLLLIGSCASPFSRRLFYTYSQRREMIKILYPDISICGLPDYKDVDDDPEFKQWHYNLWDIIKLKFPDATIYNTSFIIGSEKDAYFFKNYNTEIIDREDSIPGFSATELRERLLYDHGFSPLKSFKTPPRELKELTDSRIIDKINKYFLENFNKFKLGD